MSKIKIEYASSFIKNRQKFVKNNRARFNNYSKAIKLFIKNPDHPSLNLEKLRGSACWTIRIDKSNRIFFIWLEKTVIMLIDIGSHDKYRKY